MGVEQDEGSCLKQNGFTRIHNVEACGLGVNSGALGLRLEVVDFVVVFSMTHLATACCPAISAEMSPLQAGEAPSSPLK